MEWPNLKSKMDPSPRPPTEEKTKEETEEEDEKTKELLRWKIQMLENQGFTCTIGPEEDSRFELEMEFYRMQMQQDEKRRKKMERDFALVLTQVTHNIKTQLQLLPGKGFLPDSLLPPSDSVKWARKYKSNECAEFIRTHQEIGVLVRAYFDKHCPY